MANDMARLEQALRAAAAEGDNAAATRIAQEIRNRRAKEGPLAQETQPSAPVEPADPFQNVPTEINGVPLTEELREAILVGRSIKDPKQKRILSARIAGRLAAMSEDDSFVNELNKGQFGAGLRGFGAGIFGIGDLAAAGGTVLRGALTGENDMSFGEALEAQREFRRALEEDFPVTSGLGEVAGALTGGGLATGAIRAGARQIPGRAGQAISGLTTLERGQKAKNVLKLSAAGGATGAITEGITEDDPLSGGLTGAAFGPLGAGLVKAAGVTAGAVNNLLADPAAKGIKVLAQKLGIDAEELGRRFLEFQEATGKKPAIADIANPQAVAELRDIIATRATGTATAREAAEATTRQRAADIGEQVAGERITTTGTTQQAARGRQAARQFGEAEGAQIQFTGDQVQDLLSNPDLRRAIPVTLKRRLDEALSDVPEGQSATLSGLDVDDLRKALRKRGRGATGADVIFNDLADEVEAIAREQSPEFGRAVSEFARRSRTAEGVEAGRRAVTQPTGEFLASLENAPRETIAGIRVGLRSGLADTALENASRASRLVRGLAEDAGLVRRLKAVMKPAEVDRLQRIGRLQARAIENIERLAPGIRAVEDEGVREAVRDAVSAMVVAGGNTGGAFKANLFQRALSRLTPKLPERVVTNLARDAFDPKKVPDVIQVLRRAEVGEEDILDLFATAVAGGQLASSATGEQ